MRAEAIHPRHAPLLWVVCALQIALIAASFFISAILPVICVLTLLSLVALFGSITLSVLYLCFVVVVVPTWFYEDYLLLPLDFKFYEGLFALVMGMAGLAYFSEGRWNWRQHTALDRPMCVLLGPGGLLVRNRPGYTGNRFRRCCETCAIPCTTRCSLR